MSGYGEQPKYTDMVQMLHSSYPRVGLNVNQGLIKVTQLICHDSDQMIWKEEIYLQDGFCFLVIQELTLENKEKKINTHPCIWHCPVQEVIVHAMRYLTSCCQRWHLNNWQHSRATAGTTCTLQPNLTTSMLSNDCTRNNSCE